MTHHTVNVTTNYIRMYILVVDVHYLGGGEESNDCSAAPAVSVVIHGGSPPCVGTLRPMFGGKVGDSGLGTSLGYV